MKLSCVIIFVYVLSSTIFGMELIVSKSYGSADRIVNYFLNTPIKNLMDKFPHPEDLEKDAKQNTLRIMGCFASLLTDIQKNILDYLISFDNKYDKIYYQSFLNDSNFNKFSLYKIREITAKIAFSEKKFKINNPHHVGNYDGLFGDPISRFPKETFNDNSIWWNIRIPFESLQQLNEDQFNCLKKIIIANIYPNINCIPDQYTIQEKDIYVLQSFPCILFEKENKDNQDIIERDENNFLEFLEVRKIEYKGMNNKDYFLIIMPMVLNGIVSDLMANQLVNVIRILANGSCVRAGIYLVPVAVGGLIINGALSIGANMLHCFFFYKYHSSAIQMKKFFGPHKQYRRPFALSFLSFNILHFCGAFCTQLLSPLIAPILIGSRIIYGIYCQFKFNWEYYEKHPTLQGLLIGKKCCRPLVSDIVCSAKV